MKYPNNLLLLVFFCIAAFAGCGSNNPSKIDEDTPNRNDSGMQLQSMETTDIISTDYTVSTDVLPGDENPKEQYVEKQLGDRFRVQNVRPGTDQTIDSFTVTVIVLVFKKDEAAYDKLFEKHRLAIRESVENVLQASTSEERTQVSLRTIKQRILKTINDVIGQPYVRGVIATSETK